MWPITKGMVMITRTIAACFVGVFLVGSSQAQPILETAPLGTTNGGSTISENQYLGARFSLSTSFLITGIGGHVKSDVGGDRSVFIALIPLSGANLLPADSTLSDAIFAKSLLAPYNDVGPYPFQVPETIISTHILLDAGDYGVVFGSGLFGATGAAWMPLSGPIQNLPWLFAMNRFIADEFRNLDEQPIRFVVQGDPVSVPEPSTASLFLLAAVAAFAAHTLSPHRGLAKSLA